MSSNLANRASSRREFLRRAGLLGFGAGVTGLLSACGVAPAVTPTAAPAAAPTSAPAAPKSTTAPAAPAATTAPAAPAATTAPAAKPAAAATGEATLVLGVDAESLDPLVTTNAFSRSMMKAMFDTLVTLDPQLAPMPALATSWETPNDTTWRFKLRENVKFHDGSPFNAEVAKYSLERFVDPNTKNPEAAVLKPIAAVKVVDPNTLELTTDGPFAGTLSALQNAFIMSPTAVQAAGADVAKKPVGTGQYRFVEWIPGE